MTAATALAPSAAPGRPRRGWRWLLVVAAVLAAVLPFTMSPAPGAWLLRQAYEFGARQRAQRLDSHVPPGVVERIGLRYDAADPEARYDLYLPPAGVDPPAITVVWLHGGGWVAGSRADVANYAKVFAARGVAVVAPDFPLAPARPYPAAVQQVNAALGHLAGALAAEGLDPARIVLAGDSSGAQLAAQVAALTRSPAYARKLGVTPALPPGALRGVVLYGGAYQLQPPANDDTLGLLSRLLLWAYSGRREAWLDERFALASVLTQADADFPPTFLSVGNADPLQPQSRAFADRLQSLGVEVETLFFADDRQPPLAREFQFDLDDDAGRLALARALAFVRRHAGR